MTEIPKYTCANCESDKEPYFSRSEPMGFYCVDCGQSSDQLDLADAKATAEHWMEKAKQAEQAANDLVAELIDTKREWKEELAAERALADRLAEGLNTMVYFSEGLLARIQDRNEINYKHLNDSRNLIAAWKEARGE